MVYKILKEYGFIGKRENFITYLVKILEEIKSYKDYINYLLNRETGLREKAFEDLANFIQETNQWSEEEKREFVKTLFEAKDSANLFFIFNKKVIIPHNLQKALVEPILKRWVSEEDENSTILRWCGEYFDDRTYLFKALEISPKDERIIESILNKIIELTEGCYIDIELINNDLARHNDNIILAKELIDRLENAFDREIWHEKLNNYIGIVAGEEI